MIRFSIDDACKSDMRFAELARKYELDVVFYWPVEWKSLAYYKRYEPLSFIDALSIARDFQIGSHTVTHRHLTAISEQEALQEIADSKLILQRIFDQPIDKFCAPRGYTNQELTKYTLEFYKEQRLTKGEHLVHIHPNSGANSNLPWREAITDKTTELWGHSYDFDRFNMWEEIEEFLNERN